MSQSRRQELLEFAESGRLRDALQFARLSQEACDLLVDVAVRYCEPRRKRHGAKQAHAQVHGSEETKP